MYLSVYANFNYYCQYASVNLLKSISIVNTYSVVYKIVNGDKLHSKFPTEDFGTPRRRTSFKPSKTSFISLRRFVPPVCGIIRGLLIGLDAVLERRDDRLGIVVVTRCQSTLLSDRLLNFYDLKQFWRLILDESEAAKWRNTSLF